MTCPTDINVERLLMSPDACAEIGATSGGDGNSQALTRADPQACDLRSFLSVRISTELPPEIGTKR